MNFISKRLHAIEKSLRPAGLVGEPPEALDTLKPEDRALVLEYAEARRSGTYNCDRPEFHQAQRKFLAACVERTRMLREAGVPMESVTETLRRRQQARAELEVPPMQLAQGAAMTGAGAAGACIVKKALE